MRKLFGVFFIILDTLYLITRTKTSIKYAKENDREKRERRRERERESERERHRALLYWVCALVENLWEIS